MPLIAVDARNRRAVIAAGLRGPRGRDGAPGGHVGTFTAGATLSGHRAVFAAGNTVDYASSGDPDTAYRVVGITTQATVAGEDIIVHRIGLLTESTWSWTPGPVFLGLAGALVQTPPASGAYLQIGVALDATTLDVRIGTLIELE